MIFDSNSDDGSWPRVETRWLVGESGSEVSRMGGAASVGMFSGIQEATVGVLIEIPSFPESAFCDCGGDRILMEGA